MVNCNLHCIYLSFRQNGGAQVLGFTKLKIALTSVALSIERIKGIQRRFLIIICQRKAYAKWFIEEMAKQRTGIIVARSAPTSGRQK